jgi:hypothetical protein
VYRSPAITDFGSIAAHTFGSARKDTCPGQGADPPPGKSGNTDYITDCYDDYSHPAGSP